jgi:hypothetical protein
MPGVKCQLTFANQRQHVLAQSSGIPQTSEKADKNIERKGRERGGGGREGWGASTFSTCTRCMYM